MKTKYYLAGEEITKAQAEEKFGSDYVAARTKEAAETFMDDPLIQNDWMTGSGMFTIEFVVE